ncbi:hypothetical protein HZC53_04350 [Candidatus Uhrbacteria bacterium]|nr:hypothetical protein [Candidatus Uhrbacteria bacterium]
MSEELLKKLREQLSSDCFEINNETSATYHDYRGVSIGKTKADQAVIDGYVAEVISKMIGYPVRLVLEGRAGYGQPGQYEINFVRASPATDRK